MSVGCCRLCKGSWLEILEILAKSLRLLLAEAEELLYGDELPPAYFVGRASEDRIILVVKSTISESQVSFELKVKRCIEWGVVLRAAYAQTFEGQERIKRDRKRVRKPQSPQTKFRINAINSYKGYFVLVLQRFFRKGFLCSLNDLWKLCRIVMPYYSPS